MTKTKKTGIYLVLAGLILPLAVIPFIAEYHPQEEICLTSNLFSNLGNMVVVFGSRQLNATGAYTNTLHDPFIAIPYRYLFSLSVLMGCIGMGAIALSSRKFLETSRKAKIAGVIVMLAGIFISVATLPFIKEFRPVPELCLSSNFFENMDNMLIVLGSKGLNVPGGNEKIFYDALIVVPYRYLFSTGIVLFTAGICILVLFSKRLSSY